MIFPVMLGVGFLWMVGCIYISSRHVARIEIAISHVMNLENTLLGLPDRVQVVENKVKILEDQNEVLRKKIRTVES